MELLLFCKKIDSCEWHGAGVILQEQWHPWIVWPRCYFAKWMKIVNSTCQVLFCKRCESCEWHGPGVIFKRIDTHEWHESSIILLEKWQLWMALVWCYFARGKIVVNGMGQVLYLHKKWHLWMAWWYFVTIDSHKSGVVLGLKYKNWSFMVSLKCFYLFMLSD